MRDAKLTVSPNAAIDWRLAPMMPVVAIPLEVLILVKKG
jgi:hypothetical protein